ncbi:MAG TPA: SCO family protein, partial [Saprospiraceae bacterium]|nr:SCO family protein [Saprospiraceae bacterium]
MMKIRNLFVFMLAGMISFGCNSGKDQLPVLGNTDVVHGDTVLHQVPDILLIDQDSNQFKLSQEGDKIFVSDFFFTSCPTICPRVTKQMMRLHDRYKDDERVMLISHTIDQRHDSVSVLNRYAKNLGVDT